MQDNYTSIYEKRFHSYVYQNKKLNWHIQKLKVEKDVF